MAIKAEVKTEYPGIVPVRALESRDGLLRERSACGFFGVKRYPGDVFYLNKPEEFSPRWMEFVDPSEVPEGWAEIIAQREAERAKRLKEKAEFEAKTPESITAELVQKAVQQTILTLAGAQSLNQGRTPAIPSHEIDYSNGMKRRGRPPKLNLENAE